MCRRKSLPVSCLVALGITVALTMRNGAGQEPRLAVSAEENTILNLTNQERKKAGLPALKPNAKLFQAARFHSKNMAVKNQFSHVIDGKNPIDRAKAFGYPTPYVGENIVFGAKTPGEAMKIWMNSPHHKANILQKIYTEIGIGVYQAANGKKFHTQVFGRSAEANNAPKISVTGKPPGVPALPGQPGQTTEKLILETIGMLGKSNKLDSIRLGSFAEIYPLKMSPRKVYIIELTSDDFDTYLRLENSRGNQVTSNDDATPGKIINSRIQFTPSSIGVEQTATFRIVVTSYLKGVKGEFTLKVYERAKH